jgi:S1-C subfamily serine protease
MSNPMSDLSSFSAELERLVAAAAPAVVSVHSHRSRASGFVWRNGLVVTADEALAEEGEIEVLVTGGAAKKATLAGRDPSTNVALLRVEGADATPATLATGAVKPGALALVVGAREGETLAALGIVSLSGAKWRSLRGGEIDARIELDLSLSRVAEGGLVLDAAGRALGMAVFGPRRRVLVIPSATIERVAPRLETHGRVARGYLGLGLQPVRLDDGGVGAIVMSVDRDGPGAAAGLAQGDVIAAWDGKPLESIRALRRTLGPESVGTKATLSLRRAGAPAQVTLTIAERPAH